VARRKGQWEGESFPASRAAPVLVSWLVFSADGWTSANWHRIAIGAGASQGCGALIAGLDTTSDPTEVTGEEDTASIPTSMNEWNQRGHEDGLCLPCGAGIARPLVLISGTLEGRNPDTREPTISSEPNPAQEQTTNVSDFQRPSRFKVVLR
jgi:hypothetical protein